MHNRSDDPIPTTALWLGTGGLGPFVALSGALWAMAPEYAGTLTFWLTSYGAVILAFVGAVHWGVAMIHPRMRDDDRWLFLAWSTVPALAAWATLLIGARSGLLFLAMSFLVQYAADLALAQRFTLPAWYLRLRHSLTTVVVLSLLLALARLQGN